MNVSRGCQPKTVHSGMPIRRRVNLIWNEKINGPRKTDIENITCNDPSGIETSINIQQYCQKLFREIKA